MFFRPDKRGLLAFTLAGVGPGGRVEGEAALVGELRVGRQQEHGK